MAEIEFGERCVTSDQFAETFPKILKGRSHIRGLILGKATADGCYNVIWEGRRTVESFHKSFFLLKRDFDGSTRGE
ncbi:hypothetical protein [Mesorhizobium sp. B2-1-3A]|uniref:hypothetical protein n=1 Tax=Mesorhizobium sp. B2-1-3A TaxID=2589971 RepID=UPI00112640F7|nr:hypothetical protein [Mesorhizobium sp. B2-1-3A]TPM89878.1 hypothetical protein FJ977_35475 [Mesorhizobium sp. B2-1-3A]